MRAGLAVSIIGHIGAVMMTLLAWETRSALEPLAGAVVPVEIVNIAAESNVRALAEDVPEDEVAEQQDETQEAAPEAAPSPTPRPQRPPQSNDEFDLAAAANLFNADTKTGRERQQEGERADRNQQGVGLGTAEVAALQDRVRALGRAHVRRCWRMPADLPDPERLRVTVEFELNRNGTLNGQPRVTSPRNYTFDAPMRAAAEAALRAVRQCDPFPFPDDPIVGEHYAYWREIEMPFNVSF